MAASPGDIIVIEHQGRMDVAGWGGLLSRGAVRRGIAAVVIDGACRDIDEALELGLPIFARGTTPLTARGRVNEHSFNVPIALGGVAVKPGDWIIADSSGVVVIESARSESILALAEQIFTREQQMAAAIDRGQPISAVMNGSYETMLRRQEPW
jgi:regulator of RNase E activity RraA